MIHVGRMLRERMILREGMVLHEERKLCEGMIHGGRMLRERMILREGVVLHEGTKLCEKMMLCEEDATWRDDAAQGDDDLRGDDLRVKIFYCEHVHKLLVYSRAPDHSARLVIVKVNVVRLVHCSSRSELCLLGSAAMSVRRDSHYR